MAKNVGSCQARSRTGGSGRAMENPRNCATQWNRSCIGSWMQTWLMSRRLRHFNTKAPSAFLSGWIFQRLKNSN